MIDFAQMSKRKVAFSLASFGVLSLALVVSVFAIRNPLTLLSQAAGEKSYFYGSISTKKVKGTLGETVTAYFLNNGQDSWRLIRAASAPKLPGFKKKQVEVVGKLRADGRVRVQFIRELSPAELAPKEAGLPLCSTEKDVEGWYAKPAADNEPGTLLRQGDCRGQSVECRYIDTEYEGWYSDGDGSLITMANCSRYETPPQANPQGVSIVLNSHSDRTCTEVCQDSGKYCLSIGTDAIAMSGSYYYYPGTCRIGLDTSGESCNKKMSTLSSAICWGHQAFWTNCRCSDQPPAPGPTVPEGETIILNENSGYSCEQLCLGSTHGPCLSVGTDDLGTDGNYQASWDMNCSPRKADGCQEVLSNAASRPCNGHYTDWTNCRCRLPAEAPSSLAKELTDISVMASTKVGASGLSAENVFQVHGDKVAGLNTLYGFVRDPDGQSPTNMITFHLNSDPFPRLVSDPFLAISENTVDLYSNPDRSESAYLASFRYTLFIANPGDRGKMFYFPNHTSYVKFDYAGSKPDAIIVLSSPFNKNDNPSPVFATYYSMHDYEARGTFSNLVYSLMPPINVSDSQAYRVWCELTYPATPKKQVQSTMNTYPVQGGNFYDVTGKEGSCNLIYRHDFGNLLWGFFKLSLHEM